jgi:ferredoxin
VALSSGSDEPVGIVVDWLRCDANGVCAELVPELVGRDDWGYPVVGSEPVPPDLRRMAARARAACPTMALRVVPRPNPASR